MAWKSASCPVSNTREELLLEGSSRKEDSGLYHFCSAGMIHQSVWCLWSCLVLVLWEGFFFFFFFPRRTKKIRKMSLPDVWRELDLAMLYIRDVGYKGHYVFLISPMSESELWFGIKCRLKTYWLVSDMIIGSFEGVVDDKGGQGTSWLMIIIFSFLWLLPLWKTIWGLASYGLCKSFHVCNAIIII